MIMKNTTPISRVPSDTEEIRTVTGTAPDRMKGRLIEGGYRIITRIGRGGMATVYLARRLEDDVLCAVKIMHRALMNIGRFKDRFHIETEAVARINHPNVIQIFEHGTTGDDLLFMVMEFIPGRSLRSILDHGPVDPGRGCWLGAEIASALDAAHTAGVIHRDLKPENVFLVQGDSVHNAFGGIKVLDFGIAKLIDAPSITSTLHIIGTPEYLSPEQSEKDDIDGRSDIYSLGIMIYEAITNSLPFNAASVDDLLRKHRMFKPDPPSLKSPSAGITKFLDELLLSCMEKDPARRPQNAHSLREMFIQAAAGYDEKILY